MLHVFSFAEVFYSVADAMTTKKAKKKSERHRKRLQIDDITLLQSVLLFYE
jgi:beta-galactosidase beta subunit